MDDFGAFLLGLLLGYLIWGRETKEEKKEIKKPLEKRRTFKEWWKEQKTYEKVPIILIGIMFILLILSLMTLDWLIGLLIVGVLFAIIYWALKKDEKKRLKKK